MTPRLGAEGTVPPENASAPFSPRVLMVHSAYVERGGEDSVFESEAEMLERRGHQLHRYTRQNTELLTASAISAAASTIWSSRTTREVSRLIEEFNPDLIHVHNTFPAISPSAYWAAAKAGIPVVQTLHNFRLMCPQAMFLRDGGICTDCLGKAPLPAIVHGCFRGSSQKSAVLASMLMLHRSIGTWDKKVTRYVALNGFCRDLFVAGGLPAAKIDIKPNFIRDEEPSSGTRSGFLYVGRLSPEKGIRVLARAAQIAARERFFVAGDGEERNVLDGKSNIVKLGSLTQDQVKAQMASAEALILPSIWYENFPRTLVEAFCRGLPVIASRIGALAEIIEDGVTGILFNPDDADDLAAKIRWAASHPEVTATIARNARRLFEERYSEAANYEQLMTIYRRAISDK